MPDQYQASTQMSLCHIKIFHLNFSQLLHCSAQWSAHLSKPGPAAKSLFLCFFAFVRISLCLCFHWLICDQIALL